MKLNYYILWVEDDNSWFETTSELFEDTITSYGFHPVVERKKSLDEVIKELVGIKVEPALEALKVAVHV